MSARSSLLYSLGAFCDVCARSGALCSRSIVSQLRARVSVTQRERLTRWRLPLCPSPGLQRDRFAFHTPKAQLFPTYWSSIRDNVPFSTPVVRYLHLPGVLYETNFSAFHTPEVLLSPVYWSIIRDENVCTSYHLRYNYLYIFAAQLVMARRTEIQDKCVCISCK